MWEAPRVMNTPEGPLTSVSYVFKDGRPGYVKKHFQAWELHGLIGKITGS